MSNDNSGSRERVRIQKIRGLLEKVNQLSESSSGEDNGPVERLRGSNSTSAGGGSSNSTATGDGDKAKASRTRPCRSKRKQCKRIASILDSVYGDDVTEINEIANLLGAESEYMQAVMQGKLRDREATKTGGSSQRAVSPPREERNATAVAAAAAEQLTSLRRGGGGPGKLEMSIQAYLSSRHQASNNDVDERPGKVSL